MQIELKYTLSRAVRLKIMMIKSFSFKNEFDQFFLSLFIYTFSGLCWMFLLFLLWIIGGALLFAFLVLRIAFDTASSFSNQGFRPQR